MLAWLLPLWLCLALNSLEEQTTDVERVLMTNHDCRAESCTHHLYLTIWPRRAWNGLVELEGHLLPCSYYLSIVREE